MRLSFEITFDQLLGHIKQLSESEKEKLVSEIQSDLLTKKQKAEPNDLQKLVIGFAVTLLTLAILLLIFLGGRRVLITESLPFPNLSLNFLKIDGTTTAAAFGATGVSGEAAVDQPKEVR